MAFQKKFDSIESLRRELSRRSLDELKVFNPLQNPFKTIWDGYIHQVPAGSEKPFPRYIAEKWMREIVDHMIQRDEQELVNKENENRRKKGFNPMTPQDRENLDSQHNMYTSNADMRMKYMKIVYRGVSSEYGQDITEERHLVGAADQRPVDIAILEQLDAEMGTILPHDVEDATQGDGKYED